jgi:hypothetical protein
MIYNTFFIKIMYYNAFCSLERLPVETPVIPRQKPCGSTSFDGRGQRPFVATLELSLAICSHKKSAENQC